MPDHGSYRQVMEEQRKRRDADRVVVERDLERFPLFVNWGDSHRLANKIL